MIQFYTAESTARETMGELTNHSCEEKKAAWAIILNICGVTEMGNEHCAVSANYTLWRERRKMLGIHTRPLLTEIKNIYHLFNFHSIDRYIC